MLQRLSWSYTGRTRMKIRSYLILYSCFMELYFDLAKQKIILCNSRISMIFEFYSCSYHKHQDMTLLLNMLTGLFIDSIELHICLTYQSDIEYMSQIRMVIDIFPKPRHFYSSVTPDHAHCHTEDNPWTILFLAPPSSFIFCRSSWVRQPSLLLLI